MRWNINIQLRCHSCNGTGTLLPSALGTTHLIQLSAPSQQRCRQAWEPKQAVAARAAVRGSGRDCFPLFDSSCSRSCCLPLAPGCGPACAYMCLRLLRGLAWLSREQYPVSYVVFVFYGGVLVQATEISADFAPPFAAASDLWCTESSFCLHSCS